MEALVHDIMQVVSAECDKTWLAWERELHSLYESAEQFLTHPATMDALLQAEANTQASALGLRHESIIPNVERICESELVPGVRRALEAQLQPLQELLHALSPHTVAAWVMAEDLVRNGSPPPTEVVSGLLEAVTGTLRQWMKSTESKHTHGAPIPASGPAAVCNLLESQLLPGIAASVMPLLNAFSPELVESAMLQGVIAMDDLEDDLAFVARSQQGGPASVAGVAIDLCVDVEDGLGRSFVSGLRRLLGQARLQQQHDVSSSPAEITVGLSWGLNQVLLECLLAATQAFFLAMCAAPPLSFIIFGGYLLWVRVACAAPSFGYTG